MTISVVLKIIVSLHFFRIQNTNEKRKRESGLFTFKPEFFFSINARSEGFRDVANYFFSHRFRSWSGKNLPLGLDTGGNGAVCSDAAISASSSKINEFKISKLFQSYETIIGRRDFC